MKKNRSAFIFICFLFMIIARAQKTTVNTPNSHLSTDELTTTDVSHSSVAPSASVPHISVASSADVPSSSIAPSANDEVAAFAKNTAEVPISLQGYVTVDYDASNPDESSVRILLNKNELVVPAMRQTDDKPASIKFHLTLNVNNSDDCYNGSAIGAEVQFAGSSYCGFSYAWNLLKNKFLFTVNGDGIPEHGDLLLKKISQGEDDQPGASIEWRNEGGTISQIIRTDGMQETMTTTQNCFPDLSSNGFDRNTQHPFVMKVYTGSPNCGMNVELLNGYRLLTKIKNEEIHFPTDSPTTIDSPTTSSTGDTPPDMIPSSTDATYTGPTTTSTETATTSTESTTAYTGPTTTYTGPTTTYAGPTTTKPTATLEPQTGSVESTTGVPVSTTGEPKPPNYWILIGVGIGLLLAIIILAIVNFVIYRKNQKRDAEPTEKTE